MYWVAMLNLVFIIYDEKRIVYFYNTDTYYSFVGWLFAKLGYLPIDNLRFK